MPVDMGKPFPAAREGALTNLGGGIFKNRSLSSDWAGVGLVRRWRDWSEARWELTVEVDIK